MALVRLDKDVFLFRRAMEHYSLLFRGQIPERYIRPYLHGLAHLDHDSEHQGTPRSHSPLFYGLALIGNQSGFVHSPYNARASAPGAGTPAVESQVFRSRRFHPGPAFRTENRLFRRYFQGRRQIVAVGTAMAGEPGKHQPETVEQFRSSAEGTADPWDPGPLVESQSRWDIQHLIHRCFGRLGHPAPGVGGKGFQIPS